MTIGNNRDKNNKYLGGITFRGSSSDKIIASYDVIHPTISIVTQIELPAREGHGSTDVW